MHAIREKDTHRQAIATQLSESPSGTPVQEGTGCPKVPRILRDLVMRSSELNQISASLGPNPTAIINFLSGTRGSVLNALARSSERPPKCEPSTIHSSTASCSSQVITRMDRLGMPPLTDCGIVLIHALIVKYATNLVNRRNKTPNTVMGRKFSMAKLLPFFGMSAARA